MKRKIISSLDDIDRSFPTDLECIKYLEILRWSGFVVSPFDATAKVYKCAGNKYKCQQTGKYFNVKTGTLFDNTKIALRTWFFAIYLVVINPKIRSPHVLAGVLGLSPKTSSHLFKRIADRFKIE